MFRSAAGAINYHDMFERRALLAAEFGTDAHFSQLYVQRYSQMNPLVVGLGHHDVGSVFRIRDLVDLVEYRESRFYREWVEPQGYADLMGTVIHRDERHLGAVSLARTAGEGPYDDADANLFGRFGEHLVRAVRISDLIEHRTIAVAMFETVVCQLAAAVVIIDDAERVLFANDAAERIFRDCAVGQIVGGRLVLTELSVAELIRGVRTLKAYVAALPQRGAGQTALGLTAFALRGEVGRSYGSPIAIFLSGEQTGMTPPSALLAEMYELTGGELRVLLALLEGKPPDLIAAQFGISVATVRTHLTRLFEKTESSGQVDLIRKVTAILPPVRVSDP